MREYKICYNKSMVSSSSGPGLLVLIQAIAGSNPAEITRDKKKSLATYFYFCDENGTIYPAEITRYKKKPLAAYFLPL